MTMTTAGTGTTIVDGMDGNIITITTMMTTTNAAAVAGL